MNPDISTKPGSSHYYKSIFASCTVTGGKVYTMTYCRFLEYNYNVLALFFFKKIIKSLINHLSYLSSNNPKHGSRFSYSI